MDGQIYAVVTNLAGCEINNVTRRTTNPVKLTTNFVKLTATHVRLATKPADQQVHVEGQSRLLGARRGAYYWGHRNYR